MANPRNTVAFEGIASEAVTMKTDGVTIVYDQTKAGGSSQVGLAVTVSADKTVKLCEDGEVVMGKLLAVEVGNFGTVQFMGGMHLPGGASATLTPGRKIVGALGAASAKGYIRSVAATTGSYVQATLNDAINGRGNPGIVDASTATAVAVIL